MAAGFMAGFGQGFGDFANQLGNDAYRQREFGLRQQEFALRQRQALAELARQQQLQQLQAAYGAAVRQQMAQPTGASLGGSPLAGMEPMPPGVVAPPPRPLPDIPDATGQMVAPAGLKQQVLGLEGNQDVFGRAGEIGPGQIMPATGAQYGYSPSQLWGDSGRQASGAIVDDLFRRSGGDPAATLVGYNRGPGAMAQFQAAGDNPAALKTPLAPAYQKAVEADLSPESRRQVGQIAIGAAGMLPPQMVGQMGPGLAAQLLRSVAGSNVSDEVLGAAMVQLLPLMSREGQQQFQQTWDIYKFGVEQQERGREFDIRQSETEAQHEFMRQQAGNKGWQIVQDQGKTFRINPSTGEKEEVDLSGSAHKLTGGQPRSGAAMAAAKYLQEHPDATADDIRNFVAQTAGQVSATRGFDTGKQGDTVRSLNVAIDHLAVLQDAANALQNGDTRALNHVGNIIAKEFGISAPTDFAAVKSIVGDEIVKAVVGSGGALGDREEVKAQLDAANSPEQLAGVIKRYTQLMGGQMRGLQKQFVTSGAGDEGAFSQKLLPRTQKALKGAGDTGKGQPGDIMFDGKRYAEEPEGAIDVPDKLKDTPDGKIVGDGGRTHYVKRGNRLILLLPVGE